MKFPLSLLLFLLALAAGESPVSGQPAADYVMILGSGAGAPLSTVDIVVTFDNNGANIEGWSFGVCSNPAELEILDVADGSTTATVNNGSPPFFHALSLFPDGWNVGALISPFASPVLPPGTGYEMYITVYSIVGEVGTTSNLEFCETLGSPPVSTVIVSGGQSFLPELNGGTIDILQIDSYIRGDVSGDGALDLADAVEMLGYLFIALPAPGCLDSSDVNDSGAIDVSDAVYLLTYMFTGGIEPPAPFPSCGADETDDSIECEFYPGCP